jgi:ABC-type uncharacterized transport system permease subunit
MDLLNLFDLSVLDSTVRFTTPLLLACLAGLFSERAGIFDIGLEGKMLFAAFFPPPLPRSPVRFGWACWPASSPHFCSRLCTGLPRSPFGAIS